MLTRIQGSWRAWRAWRARQSRVARISLWLLQVIVVLWIMGHLVPGLRTFTIVLAVPVAIVLLPFLLILFYRWFTRRLMWKVRNRLILTYLLMGLAPVVLFATLAAIAGYLLAGQYATNSAVSALDRVTTEVKDETVSAAMLTLPNRPGIPSPETRSRAKVPNPPQAPERPETTKKPRTAEAEESGATWADSRISLAVLKKGVWQPLMNSTATASASLMPIAGKGPPGWLQPGFQGVVVLDRKLYICSVAEVPLAGGPVVVLGSMPLNAERMDEIGKGLGNVRMLPGFMGLRTNVDDNGDVDVDAGLDGDAQQLRRMPGAKVETFHIGKEKTPKAPKAPEAPAPKKVDGDFINVIGGKVPQAGHFWDVPVLFSAPVTVYGWNSGDEIRSMMVVVSRMTVLYAHLFANSVNTGVVVRLSLIAIAIAFALLELFALLMAAGLSRTITRSVADLYRGTREIDAGNLAHRVRVAKHDQLGALATSFNAMTASVTDLLQQQREKERMINELAIAQEVQTNLFPHSPATVGAFEMHAVCLPARTVGGDYYDFIFSQSNGLCLALGDISGKGISAAMLMASLHSAVRAFLLNTNAQPSPAQMLKLLNRHLYGSTQVERYATLFLACYDGASRKLTYANGGHLPPLVLSLDGTVRPLDCGGPVVGLLSGLEYMEATVQLQAGDLLMAFSDGLTEPENANGEFGAERLLEYVRENQQEPLPVLAANTLKAVQAWIGNNEQPDDMTILLARLH